MGCNVFVRCCCFFLRKKEQQQMGVLYVCIPLKGEDVVIVVCGENSRLSGSKCH